MTTQHDELNQYSQWIKSIDAILRPKIGRSVHDIAGYESFFYFKAGKTAEWAAQTAQHNLTRTDRENILPEAKAMFRQSQKRVILVTCLDGVSVDPEWISR